jgi:uncharacterized protein YbaP (TraB family)
MSNVIRVLVVFTSMILSAHLFAASTVFELSKGNSKVYLAGTIHMLRAQDFPPPAEFDAAYRQSQRIYFETDILYTKTPEFGQRFARAMTLPDNKSLKDVLDAGLWAELQSFSEKNHFPLNQFMNYSPAMLSILITITESKKMGVGDGIDVYYDKLARHDKKFVGEMESGDDVISYMKNFSQKDPNRIIKSTLSDVKNIPEDLNTMIISWRAGDLDALEHNMGEKMRTEMPEAYKSLVIDRNKKWLPKIEKMFATPEIEMVMVGSLHLPGQYGLLASLKKSGYKIKPYQINNNQ